MKYEVQWAIEVDAQSHEDAAKNVHRIYFPKNLKTGFVVRDLSTKVDRVVFITPQQKIDDI